MFKLKKKNRLLTTVKALLSSSLPYEVRVPTGDWSPYFGKYENQKWGGYDSDSCWCLSSVNCFEDQMEWLRANNKFSTEALAFFTTNGYIDTDGDFSLSERFHEILDGDLDSGGYPEQAWKSFKDHGMIPRSMLTYSVSQADAHPNRADFIYDYFNPQSVTQEMRDLGQKFLKYVDIGFQTIGTPWTTPSLVELQAALKQAPINIGISCPVLNVYLWNNTYVKYDGGKTPQHEVELYAADSTGYKIFDQYLPNLKTLSPDYYLIYCHQGVVNVPPPAPVVVVETPIPVVPIPTPTTPPTTTEPIIKASLWTYVLQLISWLVSRL